MLLRALLIVCFLVASPLGSSAYAAGGASASTQNAEGSNSPYFAITPMPVSIIHRGRGNGLLVVEIGLDTHDISHRPHIEHLVPRLRDLYVQVLNLYASRDLKPNRPPNIEIIGARLQAATDQIVGEDYHVTVLFRQVIVRPNQNK